MTMDSQERHNAADKERQDSIDLVLASEAPKKVVVAGPGTGKTHLFKKVLAGKDNALTLSFVNSLIDDLAQDLCGMSEVRTLHAFARSALSTATKQDVRIFPKLSQVVGDDAKLLLGKSIKYDALFYNRDEEHEDLPFYRERRKYYDYYGYTDVILAAVRYFENHRDRVPVYQQVLVDEFQDFNLLEVSLIDLLAERSPILLAGDDDQALYDFKSASAEHIRQRHDGENSEYVPFNLPFCSRCTRVIVDATNDVVTAAQKMGLLKGRINKPYRYFDHKDKDRECEQFPHLVYKQVYSKQIPWVIETQLEEMAKQVQGKFTALVISPTSTQCRDIAAALRKKGLQNVEYTEREPVEPSLLDGLRLLLDDAQANLGWRVVAQAVMPTKDFGAVLKASGARDKPFAELLPKDVRNHVKGLLRTLKRVIAGESLDDEAQKLLFENLGIDPQKAAIEELVTDIASDGKRCSAAIRKVPIKVTSVQSSKGLAADLVFIANFDDRYFIRDRDGAAICDQDVCSFVVALTRARKKIVLVSSTKNECAFLGWINKDRVQRL